MQNGLGSVRVLSRVAAVLLVGSSLAACSSVPGWVDPTTWFGPDTSDMQTADLQYPDLSKIPAKPEIPDDAAKNPQIADSLAAARDQVEYSADQLRSGSMEAEAPPPADASQPANAHTGPIINDLTAEQAEPDSSSDDSDAAAPSPPAAAAPVSAPAPESAPTPIPAMAVPDVVSVHVAGNGSALSQDVQQAVAAMVQAFAARGGKGYVRVTGYGGAAAQSLSVIEAQFDRAQAHARLVVAALIKAGMPSDHILTDVQSLAPSGETGRVDIALQ